MKTASDHIDEGSFRDPAGVVFWHKNTLYRAVQPYAKDSYDLLMSSGLYDALTTKGLLVKHTEARVQVGGLLAEKPYKVIKPELIPFISYPYEWTFDQLKAAALLTLRIMQMSLKHGMILKDASAYNVQFIGSRPVFIDTLSFDVHPANAPWEGYKQFCEHFVTPLALAHYSNADVLKLQQANLDGIPLQLAAKLLPRRARLRPGLLAHVYMHNRSQQRHKQGGEAIGAKAKTATMTPLAMQGLLTSLESLIKKLGLPHDETEWGEYYDFTNYSDKAFKTKRAMVAAMLKKVSPTPRVVWDVGANNGEFSSVAAEQGAYVVAFDVDPNAVTHNYRAKRQPSIKDNILPLLQDLTNPSPALGWAHRERQSLAGRGKADVVMALALIHHLAIGNNLPFDKVASFLHDVGHHIIIEFVPKGDSKVDHLLASRKDIFTHYDDEHFEAAMGKYFTLVEKKLVKGSKRSLYLYKAK